VHGCSICARRARKPVQHMTTQTISGVGTWHHVTVHAHARHVSRGKKRRSLRLPLQPEYRRGFTSNVSPRGSMCT
jgi:hypothetical protein